MAQWALSQGPSNLRLLALPTISGTALPTGYLVNALCQKPFQPLSERFRRNGCRFGAENATSDA